MEDVTVGGKKALYVLMWKDSEDINDKSKNGGYTTDSIFKKFKALALEPALTNNI